MAIRMLTQKHQHCQIISLVVFVLLIFNTKSADNKFGIRRDVKYLSLEEKEEMKAALYKMKQVPSRFNSSLSAWDYFPYIHAVQFRDYIMSHRTCAFLPWHRAFQYLLEEELNFFMNRTADENRFKIPYWNPTDTESTAATLEDTNFLGGTGNPDSDPPFLLPDEYAFGGVEKWPVTFGTLERGPPGYTNMSQYRYPSLARWIGLGIGTEGCGDQLDHTSLWDDLFELEVYDVAPYNNTHIGWNHSHCQRSFRAQLEGCNAVDAEGCSVRHSTLHRYIGGHVTDLYYSPNDPLFFMLHGWVDAVWAQWQDIHDPDFDNFPAHFLDDSLFQGAFNGDPFTARDVMDAETQLFYKYDVQESGDDGGKQWYEDFEEPWVYLLIVGVLVLVVGMGWIIHCQRKRKRDGEWKENIYKNVDLKDYGTNEKL